MRCFCVLFGSSLQENIPEILQQQWRLVPCRRGANVSRLDGTPGISGCGEGQAGHVVPGAFHSHLHLAAAAPHLPMYLTGPREFLVFQVPFRSFVTLNVIDTWSYIQWHHLCICIYIYVYVYIHVDIHIHIIVQSLWYWIVFFPSSEGFCGDLCNIIWEFGVTTCSKVRDLLEYVPWIHPT